MCGRFALTVPHEAVAEIFGADPDPALIARGPRFNICPTQEVEAIRVGAEGREVARMRWGLLPHWYKAPNGGPLIINARAETIAEKPAFAKSVRERRCLIPASGFYEWRSNGEKQPKTPFWIHPAGTDGPVGFAGVWREWAGADGQRIETCAIVTTAASETLKPLHHRAPLAIRPDDWPLWLGEEGKGAARLMTPPDEDFWAFHEVGREIGKNSADGEGLMAPVSETRLV